MISPDGVAPTRMVGVSASVNLPLHHKVQKFSSGTGSPGGPGKRTVKRLWYMTFEFDMNIYYHLVILTLVCFAFCTMYFVFDKLLLLFAAFQC